MKNPCNWCGQTECKAAPGKPYCTDCSDNCVQECATCRKPYPNLKKFSLHHNRCNSCQNRHLRSKGGKKFRREEVQPQKEITPPPPQEPKEDQSSASDNESADDDDSSISSVKELDQDDEILDSDDNSTNVTPESSKRGDADLFKNIAGVPDKSKKDDEPAPKKSKIVQKTILEALEASTTSTKPKTPKKKRCYTKRTTVKSDPTQLMTAQQNLLKAILEYEGLSKKKGQILISL